VVLDFYEEPPVRVPQNKWKPRSGPVLEKTVLQVLVLGNPVRNEGSRLLFLKKKISFSKGSVLVAELDLVFKYGSDSGSKNQTWFQFDFY
jgi:hypothetical protein